MMEKTDVELRMIKDQALMLAIIFVSFCVFMLLGAGVLSFPATVLVAVTAMYFAGQRVQKVQKERDDAEK